jgi:hypothetical protein
VKHGTQRVLRVLCDKILVVSTELSSAGDAEEPTKSANASETTEAAHRYFLGFLVMQLGQKYGHGHFVNFRMQGAKDVEECGSLWWTKGVNRGGLVYCSEGFCRFFEKILEIEEEYFENFVKNTEKLKLKLLGNAELVENWVNLPWATEDRELKMKSLKEALRLHVGGRARGFVKYVKENHKNANRLSRSKKPLRKQLEEKK